MGWYLGDSDWSTDWFADTADHELPHDSASASAGDRASASAEADATMAEAAEEHPGWGDQPEQDEPAQLRTRIGAVSETHDRSPGPAFGVDMLTKFNKCGRSRTLASTKCGQVRSTFCVVKEATPGPVQAAPPAQLQPAASKTAANRLPLTRHVRYATRPTAQLVSASSARYSGA